MNYFEWCFELYRCFLNSNYCATRIVLILNTSKENNYNDYEAVRSYDVPLVDHLILLNSGPKLF